MENGLEGDQLGGYCNRPEDVMYIKGKMGGRMEREGE